MADAKPGFILAISLLLWFTTLFTNFAQAIAEGRGKAQADSLRKAKRDIITKKLDRPEFNSRFAKVNSVELVLSDHVLVVAGEQISADGDVVKGAASVDESAITGEAAPVIREAGGDRSAVTGGTTVLSDRLVISVTSMPGDSFLDRIIAMVKGASRQKTPNKIALQILLVALTIIFLIVCATLLPYSMFAVKQVGSGSWVSMTSLIALLVCLAPTTIGALLSSIGIAGMSRLNQANVLAMSTRRRHAAGRGTG